MPAKKSASSLRQVYGKTEDRYLELIRRFPLRPIRTAEELNAAAMIVDDLIDRPSLSPPEQDYLDVLGDLVAGYEAEAVPLRPVGDAELLRYLIQQKRVTQSQVATETGIPESVVSEVLSGKRTLNRSQIGKLAKFFHVGPGVFLAGA